MKARRFGRSRHAATASAALLVTLMAGGSLAGAGDDCPPNPEPGKCYEKVYRPAQYESYVDQEADQQRPAPQAYRPVTKQRKIREASFVWQVISCDGRLPARRDH
ncbi:hypothetical protein [Caulobacter sp. UC70_42]|uniref:hypothetical protein n=1 Tax=Caulobacter sp. UC70_42 TaxID=3374551 RepID=UPI003756A4F8